MLPSTDHKIWALKARLGLEQKRLDMIEFVELDLNEPASVTAALTGVDTAFLTAVTGGLVMICVRVMIWGCLC